LIRSQIRDFGGLSGNSPQHPIGVRNRPSWGILGRDHVAMGSTRVGWVSGVGSVIRGGGPRGPIRGQKYPPPKTGGPSVPSEWLPPGIFPRFSIFRLIRLFRGIWKRAILGPLALSLCSNIGDLKKKTTQLGFFKRPGIFTIGGGPAGRTIWAAFSRSRRPLCGVPWGAARLAPRGKPGNHDRRTIRLLGRFIPQKLGAGNS